MLIHNYLVTYIFLKACSIKSPGFINYFSLAFCLGCTAGQRTLGLYSIEAGTELKQFTSGLTGSKNNVKINSYQI